MFLINISLNKCVTRLLKFVPDWFVTNKMIKKLFTTLYTNENTLYFNEDSGNVTFICNGMGIFSIDLNNSNLYNKDDPDIIIHVRFLAWHIKFRKRKNLEKELSEKLMPVA